MSQQVSARPVVNKDARSPYGRYGKRPYVYPAWVVNKQPPPPEIQEELRLAGEEVRRRGAAERSARAADGGSSG